MNFTTDFLEKTTALFQQAFTLKKYKAMHIVLAILVGIVMLLSLIPMTKGLK